MCSRAIYPEPKAAWAALRFLSKRHFTYMLVIVDVEFLVLVKAVTLSRDAANTLMSHLTAHVES